MRNTEYAKRSIRKAKKEYMNIILRTPDIGGKKNPLASNIYMGTVFIACYQVAKNEIDKNVMDNMISNALENSIIIKLFCSRKHQTTEKYRKWVRNTSKWTQENADRYSTNWIMQENPSVSIKKQDTYFEFTRCALCELCKQEGCFEIMPALCKTDFITANFGKSRLIRKSTLADGSSCCDFLFIEKTLN